MRASSLIAPVLAACLVGACLAASRPARAGGDEVATAQVLFDDGKRLMAQERWAEACPKLQESQRLAPAIGTEFNLADCLEHQGRLASAWAAFLDVVDQTHKRGESQREAAARTRASALAPRLGKLTIQVPARAAGLQIFRDGEALPPEVWGVGVPVDAGDHDIEARAPGRASWTTMVRTADGATATTTVPDLAPAPAAPPPPAAASSPPSAAPEPPPPSSPDHTASLIVLGSAVVLAGVGVTGLLEHASNVSNYNADPSCPSISSATRPAQCNDDVNAANTWNTIGIVGFVGSGAALVAGVTLWLLSPSRPATAAASFGCAPGAGALVCAGTF